jgi:hypothetical protein
MDSAQRHSLTGAIAANQPICALITPVLCVQDGQYDQIAERIAAAVKLNCGQKAVLLAHSMGGNVMLHMLRLPRFKQWRCVMYAALLPTVHTQLNLLPS